MENLVIEPIKKSVFISVMNTGYWNYFPALALKGIESNSSPDNGFKLIEIDESRLDETLELIRSKDNVMHLMLSETRMEAESKNDAYWFPEKYVFTEEDLKSIAK
ncbi:MAG: hypothetical protein AAF620_15290 [Bacteroidota bacterium]